MVLLPSHLKIRRPLNLLKPPLELDNDSAFSEIRVSPPAKQSGGSSDPSGERNMDNLPEMQEKSRYNIRRRRNMSYKESSAFSSTNDTNPLGRGHYHTSWELYRFSQLTSHERYIRCIEGEAELVATDQWLCEDCISTINVYMKKVYCRCISTLYCVCVFFKCELLRNSAKVGNRRIHRK